MHTVVRSARVGRRKVTKGAGSIYAALGRLSYAKCDLAVMQFVLGLSTLLQEAFAHICEYFYVYCP